MGVFVETDFELMKDTLPTVARIARGAVSLENPALTAHHLLSARPFMALTR